MPAYNAEKYIRASIDSVLNQTCRDWELLVVNDGSVDHTAQLVEEYSFDKRIKLFTQVNKRLGGARNTGIRNASGRWIAFLDADDLWAPEKLKKQLAFAEENPEVSVIFTDGYIFFGDDLTHLTPYPVRTGYFPAIEMYRLEYEFNNIPVLSVIVKKDLIDQIGLQEEHPFFLGCEDWDYWLRMARSGATFYGMSDRLFYYRRHNNNMSGNQLGMDLARAAAYLKNFDASVFDNKQKQRIFFPFIDYIAVQLAATRPDAAMYLYAELNKLGGDWHTHLNGTISSVLSRRSGWLIKSINRLYTIGNRLFRQ